MKHNYKLLRNVPMLLALFITMSYATAQTEVNVSAGTLLNEFIDGDTTATGARNDSNTMYVLERGQIYQLSNYIRLTNVPLQIKSAPGDGIPAIILLKDDGTGSYPQAIRTRGDVYLEDIYMSCANGEGAQPEWGGFRTEGANTTIVLKNCLFEMDKASVVQVRENGQRIIIENCIAGKMGDYNRNNGNGRLIDCREFDVEKIEVRNSSMYHLADRIVRNMQGGKIDSFIFEQNTGLQIQGYHGLFHLGNAGYVSIKDNLFLNPKYMGDWYNVNEQTGPSPDNESHWLFTADTIDSDTEFNISHNNFYWEQELLDWYDEYNDTTTQKCPVLAPIIATEMGASANDVSWELSFAFDNPVPPINYEYLDTLFQHPAADPTPDNWPMPEGLTIFTLNLDFTTSNIELINGSSTGGQLGDLNWTGTYDGPEGINNSEYNTIDVSIYPNPANDFIRFDLESGNYNSVVTELYDLSGKTVMSVSGQQVIPVSNLAAGLYFIIIKTEEGTVTDKVTISR